MSAEELLKLQKDISEKKAWLGAELEATKLKAAQSAEEFAALRAEEGMLKAIQTAEALAIQAAAADTVADGLELGSNLLPKDSVLARRLKLAEEMAKEDREVQRKEKKRRAEALEREGKGAAAGLTPEQIEHRQRERARIEAIVDEEKRKRREAELERDKEITRKAVRLRGRR